MKLYIYQPIKKLSKVIKLSLKPKSSERSNFIRKLNGFLCQISKIGISKSVIWCAGNGSVKKKTYIILYVHNTRGRKSK